jgi:hypothetical protein
MAVSKFEVGAIWYNESNPYLGYTFSGQASEQGMFATDVSTVEDVSCSSKGKAVNVRHLHSKHSDTPLRNHGTNCHTAS